MIIKPFIPKLEKRRVAAWRITHPPPRHNIKGKQKSCPKSKVNTIHAKVNTIHAKRRSNKCCAKSFLKTARDLAFKIDIGIVLSPR